MELNKIKEGSLKYNKLKMEGVMKKQFLSLVMVLAFMCIASFAFAQGSSQSTDNTQPQPPAANAGGSLSQNTDVGITSGTNLNAITSRISAVYNYSGGQLIAVGDAARGITLISNGKAFATLSYDPTNSSYSVASVNLSGLDWNKINSGPGATAVDKLTNFLEGLGIPAKDLQTQPAVYTASGALVNFTANTSDTEVSSQTGGKYATLDAYLNRGSEPVAWLQTAVDSLTNGINQGISINFSASGGATLTTMTNGQATATYNATLGFDGKMFQSAAYYYTNGFLTSVSNFTYEVSYDSASQNFIDGYNTWVGNNPTYTTTVGGSTVATTASQDANSMSYYVNNVLSGGTNNSDYKAYSDISDKLSKGSADFKISTTTTFYNSYGQASYVTQDGSTISTYNYSTNGSLVSSVDLTTNMKTLYVNGQASQVLNSSGSVVSQYNYNNNGTINNVVGYNNGTMVTVTAFAFNKELATANLSNGPESADQIRNAYVQMTTTPNIDNNTLYTIAQNNHLTTIQAYAGQLNNTNFINFVLSGTVTGSTTAATTPDSDLTTSLAVMNRCNNGISPVATASLVFGLQTNTTYTDDGITFQDKQVTDSSGNVTTVTAKEQLQEYIVAKATTTGHDSELVVEVNGSTQPLVNSSGQFNTYTAADGTTKTYSASDLDLTHSLTAGKGHDVQSTTVTNPILNVDTNVNAYGATVFSLTGANINLNKINGNNTTTSTTDYGGYDDPAVVGTVDSFVGANGQNVVMKDGKAYTVNKDGSQTEYNGQIYAKVDASGVNMMDGSGFKAANGEEILVGLSASQASQLSIGKEAMFMGDVQKSVNGTLTMSINTSYNVKVGDKTYDGMVTGNDVQSAKAEIQSESSKAVDGDSKYAWMNTNTQTNRGLFGLGSGSYLNDWVSGWQILAGMKS
jgi:hypothetical protein